MKEIKLLQLGDIHYPDNKTRIIGDVKDSAAPKGLIDAVIPLVLQTVMRRITEVIRDESPAALLFCGDLTSRGDLTQYDQCIAYFEKVLSLSARSPDSVHAVPGNHDIDRTKCDPAGADLKVKFAPLEPPWARIGLPILPINGVRATALTTTTCALNLYSINSCMGCGERRSLPAGIATDLKRILDDYGVTAPIADAFKLLGEQLDSPAFIHSDIDELILSISRLGSSCLPVVLTHHNIFPQAIPRVELYTELINGGLIRSRLTSCNRPIIYCHGHIHSDPIEQIIDQRFPAGRVTVISAPEIVDGFNLITVIFARNDQPIGCEVAEYRTKPHGGVDVGTVLRIPLVGTTRLGQFSDTDLTGLIRLTTSSSVRFDDLWNSFKIHVRHVVRATLRELLIEAEWLSMVSIEDRESATQHWKIRRVEP